MAFSRKLLAPGEQVVLESHPNWSILVPRVALALAVIAGCAAIAVAWSSAPLWVGYILLGVGLVALAGVLAKVVTWRSTTLVITNARVVYRTGVLRRLGREIPLNRVQDVTYRQSLLERLLGTGSLTVESAGQTGREPFPDIAQPATVQSLINSLTFDPGGHRGPAHREPPRDGEPTAQYLRAPEEAHSTWPRDGEPTAQYLRAPEEAHSSWRHRGPPTSDARSVPSPRVATDASTAGEPPAPVVLPPRWVGAIRERSPAGGPGEAGRSPSEELAHLDELNRLGVITDAELADKRREVLGRE